MVKDNSDSEKGNPQGFFYMHHPTDRITHTTAFVTPVVEHWLEREIAQWVHPMKDRSDDPSNHERTLYLWATSHSLFNRVYTCLFTVQSVIRVLCVHVWYSFWSNPAFLFKSHRCLGFLISRIFGHELKMKEWRKEIIIVFFNDTFNTLYLQLYVVRHIKDHLDYERKPTATSSWVTLSC